MELERFGIVQFGNLDDDLFIEHLEILNRQAHVNLAEDCKLARVELKVPYCCEGCEEKIQSHRIVLEGVDSVPLDSDIEKVITGKVQPEDVLKEAKRVLKRSDFWPRYEAKKPDGMKGTIDHAS